MDEAAFATLLAGIEFLTVEQRGRVYQALAMAEGSVQKVGDQAASGDSWTVLDVGSNRVPKPSPNAPL
jgi:hypothetical protein